MWLETVSNGKKSEMLIRAGEQYTELTSEPKAIEKQEPAISHIMASQKGKIFKIQTWEGSGRKGAEEGGSDNMEVFRRLVASVVDPFS